MACFDPAELKEKACATPVPKLDVEGPPCNDCEHWNPQVNFATGATGQYASGYTLCHSLSQNQDFSCFVLIDDIPF